jgi:hypothetical protein
MDLEESKIVLDQHDQEAAELEANIKKIAEKKANIKALKAKLAAAAGEDTTVKPLHKAESIIQVLSDGYFFVRHIDGIVRYRTHDAHDDHLESLEFVEPPKPILTGRGN